MKTWKLQENNCTDTKLSSCLVQQQLAAVQFIDYHYQAPPGHSGPGTLPSQDSSTSSLDLPYHCHSTMGICQAN